METEYADETTTETMHRVTIDHVHIPFGEMVILLVKLAFAILPAGVIVAVVTAVTWILHLGLAR